MDSWVEYTMMYIAILPMFLLSFTPYFTRKTENFGVTIPFEMHGREDFRKMRKKFTLRMSIIHFIFLIGLIFIQVQFGMDHFIRFFTIAIIVLLILFFIVYLPFHQNMKKIKKAENWVFTHKQQRMIDTNFRKANVVHSYQWYLIPFFIIVGTIIYSFAVYDQIPNQIPTHTGVGGVVTYSDKSPGVLMMLPFMQLFMLLIMIGSHYAIKISKQSIDVANPDASREQNKTFRRYWSMFLILTSIGMTFLFSYLQLAMIHDILFQHQGKVILFITIGLIISLILLTIRTGQSGSRLGDSSGQHTDVMEVDEDEHWIIGQIYFNRKDPTIFVEKRFGVGWTVNFARPIVWFLFALLFSPLLIPLFL